MNKSLDEFIRNKKIKPGFRNRLGDKGNLKRKPFVNRIQNKNIITKPKLIDARQKIIQNTKKNLPDARLKLKPKDARLKIKGTVKEDLLGSKQFKDLRKKLNYKEKTTRNILGRNSPLDLIKQTLQQDGVYLSGPLKRTIRNQYTGYGSIRQPTRMDMEYMDLDSPLTVDPITIRGDRLYRSVPSDNYYDPRESRHLMPTMTIINDISDPPMLAPASHVLSSHMKSRLDESSIQSRSMGIFGNSGSSSSRSSSSKSSKSLEAGYRIVVSNLKESVNGDDIKELFEDIGPLIASRVVRPGTAEVIYKHQKDAIKAVETYHNRQLDRQPMKCMLVTPRAGSNPLIPAVQKVMVPPSKASSVLPDIHAVHKALFNRAM